MIEFGKTLRAAREAKGYSTAQLAETTRLAPSTVEDMEREDFSRIAAPIYGRGFVKLYCEAVGLDPKPLVAEFMEIYNGNRQPDIKERKPAAPFAEPIAEPLPPPAPVPEPEPEPEAPAAEEPPAPPEMDLFSAPAAPPPSASRYAPPDPPAAAAPEAPRISRYATPLSQIGRFSSGVNPAVWRFALLAVVLAALCWLAAIGARALYRATQPAKPQQVENPAAETPPPAPAAAPAAQPAAPAPAKPREPQQIPPLYID